MKILLAITAFVLAIFIRNLAFWSSSQTFPFGDTAIYSLQLVSLAKHFNKIFDPKESIFLWNPNYLSVGVPALSLVDYGLTYPVNWLIAAVAHLAQQPFLVFPLYTLSLFTHLIFGAFFVYKLLKVSWKLPALAALVGALTWLYNGFNLEWVGAGPILIAASYLPFCLFVSLQGAQTGSKKYFWAYYLALALSFLIGYPMVSLIIHGVGLAVGYFFRNSSKEPRLKFVGRHLIGLTLITLPLISPLYFSSFLNLSYSVRQELKLDSFLQNPVPLLNLPEPLLPKNTFFNTLNRINSVYLYFSLVGLLLILQAGRAGELLKDKKNAFFLFIGALGLILALGPTTSLPSLAYFLMPGINLFRRLSVFSILPNLVFALFVGQAVQNALENKKLSRRIVSWLKFLLVLVVYTQILNILYTSQKDNPFDVSLLYQSLFLSLLLTGLTLMVFFYARPYPRAAQYFLIFVLFLEAGTGVASKVYVNSKIDPAKIFKPNSLLMALKERLKPMERVDLLATQHSYSTDFYDLEQTQGYLSLASRYGVEINDALTSETYQKKNLRDLLGLRYLVRKEPAIVDDAEKIGRVRHQPKNPEFYAFNYLSRSWEPEDGSVVYSLFGNPTALPRLFLAEGMGTVNNQGKEVLRIIESLESPKTVIINRRDFQPEMKAAPGTVRVVAYQRNYLRAEVSSQQPTYLANATAFYPGWWAKINHEWVKPVQTNWFMMGLYLPAGRNTVEFFYLPYGLLAGSAYLLIALIFWSGVYFKLRLEHQKK